MVLLLFISIIISVCFALVFLSYSSTDFTFFDKNTEEKRLILLVISLLIILLGLLFAFWSSSKTLQLGRYAEAPITSRMIAIFTYVGVEVTHTKQFGRIIEGSS